jgi:TolB-like protein/tRNA A-37 threonylcarbamoyl transferase component Bud32
MKSSGGLSDSLTDSLAGIVESQGKCEQCGSATRVAQGACVNCFLKEGLTTEGEASPEHFVSVLGEADVPDEQWRLGNYEIFEEIGRGGMGVIYRARQRHSRRIVALKRVLTYHADSHETLARFRREAEAAASLDHPNILPIYEVSETKDGLPFFSMKLATGGSLRTIGPGLRAKPRECVRLMAKIARAIDYAHAQKILHRDLQPGNILLDARGEPMVSDFGLAKWLDEESDLTRTLTTFGTPGFIAPEPAEGAGFSPAADIYSLGAILFNLLAGRPPFMGPNALSIIRQASASPAPKLRVFAPALGRDLETIVARCLERDPKARYQTAGALAEDLERWLAGRPIVARPVSVPARVWRWSRRNPTLATAAAGCLLLGVAVVWLVRELIAPAQEVRIPEKSIAVLPFENLSQDQQNAYFAAGVQDEILSDLAKIADLKVISRTSVMQYKSGVTRNLRQIAQQLGVANVLEGSVQRVGQRVRVNAQLVDARSDQHLWAQTYDRDLVDVFAIQSEIAQTIAVQLQAKISEREKAAIAQPPTTDLVANALYVQAREVVFKEPGPQHQSWLEAVRLLEEAVARDPHFLLAYCELGRLHLLLFDNGYDHTPARRELANAAIQNAVRLQPDAGEVHRALALYAYKGFFDYDRARAELELARRTLPNDAEIYNITGRIDCRQGRWTEAIRNLERAVELDPRNWGFLGNAAFTYRDLRRYSKSSELIERWVVVAPPNKWWTRMTRTGEPFRERADVRPMRKELSAILAQIAFARENNLEQPEAAKDSDFAEALFFCAMAERDSVAVNRAIDLIPAEGILLYNYKSIIYPREWFVGVAARAFNDTAAAHTSFTAARAIAEKIVSDQPDNEGAWILLGLIDAGLGRKEEALREGRRACELLPLSRDAVVGPILVTNLASIYAWTGEKDLALEQLALSAQIPAGVTYGDLKLDPQWDPLRGDPRFQKIVASLAPKL